MKALYKVLLLFALVFVYQAQCQKPTSVRVTCPIIDDFNRYPQEERPCEVIETGETPIELSFIELPLRGDTYVPSRSFRVFKRKMSYVDAVKLCAAITNPMDGAPMRLLHSPLYDAEPRFLRVFGESFDYIEKSDIAFFKQGDSFWTSVVIKSNYRAILNRNVTDGDDFYYRQFVEFVLDNSCSDNKDLDEVFTHRKLHATEGHVVPVVLKWLGGDNEPTKKMCVQYYELDESFAEVGGSRSNLFPICETNFPLIRLYVDDQSG